MAKDKAADKGQYGDVVERLQAIVDALETGQLSLEDSIDRFTEGMALVKQGEKLLSAAEQRVEQLLSEDGRTAPLKVPEAEAAAVAAPHQPQKAPVKRPTPADDDDVPF